MKAEIKKWGNSLALRIPTAFVKEISLAEGGQVNLSLKDGGLFLVPVKKKKEYLLSNLLEGISDENLHSEIDTGDPEGAEHW